MKKIKISVLLDDDVVSNIFLLIPVEILHNTVKLVCRQWRRIIENNIFIKQHILNSELIVLKQINHDHAYSRCNIKIQDNSIDVVVIETEKHLQFPGRVISSIDGLVMCSNRHDNNLYVSNPATKEVVKLPSSPKISNTHHQLTLVPVISGLEYKLVSTCLSLDSCELYVYITSIGKQSGLWRSIDHSYGGEVKIPEQFEVSAIPVESFLFWAKHNCDYIISLDMKTEKIIEFPAPAVDVRRNYVYYIKMKNKLSCIHWKDQGKNWAVYLCEVSRKTGIYQWSKVYEIDWNSGCYVPLAWSENGEVLIFTCKCFHGEGKPEIVAFNVVSKSSTYFSYGGVNTPGISWQLHHVDSLASLVSNN